MMSTKVNRAAVVLEDTLASVGLRTILSDYFYPIEVDIFQGPDEFSSAVAISRYDFCFICHPFYNCLCSNQHLLHECKIVVAQKNPGRPDGNVSVLDTALTPEEIIQILSRIIRRPMTDDTENRKELTARETDVLKLVVTGKINKEIADELSIGFQTVLSHRKNITNKLGIKTVSGLTFYALSCGLVRPEDIKEK